ncbi:MAG: hypothetical protein IJ620_01560 [Bacteroidales bacterium]|nr:hypothetical protein [Bacteroidales bacterium]
MEDNNTFEQDMQSQNNTTTNEGNALSKFNEKVNNANAEAVLGTLAKVVLWVGIVLCGIAVLVGLFTFLRGIAAPEWVRGTLMLTGLGTILGAAFAFLMFLISWANIKLKVNISRNLFIIKKLLEKQGEK